MYDVSTAVVNVRVPGRLNQSFDVGLQSIQNVVQELLVFVNQKSKLWWSQNLNTYAADIIIRGLYILEACVVVCCETEGQTLLESVRLKHLEQESVNDLFGFFGEHVVSLEAEVQRRTSANLLFEVRVKFFEISIKFIFLLLRSETSPTALVFSGFDETLLVKIHAVEFLVDDVEKGWHLLDPIVEKRENDEDDLLGCVSQLIFRHIQFIRFFIYIL